MKIVNKKKIFYNGTEYFITIKKTKEGILTNEYYHIKIYRRNIKLHSLLLRYKCLFKHETTSYKFNKDIDKVIEYSFDKFKYILNETKYVNNTEEQYMIDNEWEERLYKDFYNRVIKDLKSKNIIPKEINL